jgi:hypothetical protein
MAFERLGWLLIGITPGYDREMVAPGVEARIRGRLRQGPGGDHGLLHPDSRNMTDRTKAVLSPVVPSAPLDAGVAAR